MNHPHKCCLFVAATICSVVSLGCSLTSLEPQPPLFELELYGADGLSFSDNINGPYDDSQINLGDALERAQQAVRPDEDLLVRIAADDAVSYGRLKTFIGLFIQRGLRKFELQFSDQSTYAFGMPAPATPPTDSSPNTRELPPFNVRLCAAELETLDSIHIDGRQVDSFNDLRNEIILRLGDERGPGSIADTAVVVMEADDNVLVLDLRQAFEAVAGYSSSNGEFVPLVQEILPMPLDPKDTDLEFREVYDFNLQPD